MARPIKIRGAWFYRQRVPIDVARKIGKAFVKESLNTREDAVARARFPAVAARFQTYFDEVRRGIQTLTSEQAEAIAGEIYAALVKEGKDRTYRGMPHALWWNIFLGQCGLAQQDEIQIDGGTVTKIEYLESVHGDYLSNHLAKRGMQVCMRSRWMLLHAVNRAALQAANVVLRKEKGDHADDPEANRFPKMMQPDPTKTFEALYEEYRKVKKRDPENARRSWHFFESLIDHVGSHDMRVVTEDHLLAWRDKLQTNGKINQETIRDGYFAAVKALFKWAKRQKKLPFDPCVDVFIEVSDDEGKDMRGLTDEEADMILGASLGAFNPSIGTHMRAARRWVPWLCAYTGARVNEITQLRRQDVVEFRGIPCVHLRPEAGNLKNKVSKRMVPLHPHLMEMGFLDFVNGGANGDRLFYDEKRVKAKRPTRTIGNRLREWVRGLGIVDAEVAPFHGWRHRFKTEGRRCGMILIYLDAIQGHAPRTQGEDYGEFPPDLLLPEILKYPRYQVQPLAAIDGRRRETKARKKAMAGASTVAPKPRARPEAVRKRAPAKRPTKVLAAE